LQYLTNKQKKLLPLVTQLPILLQTYNPINLKP
jgi:hypothetical protein